MFNYIIKGLFDYMLSTILLIFFSPIMVLFSFLIWKQDFGNPFYVAPRVGKNGNKFKMIKFRSMILGADRNQVDSTSSDDKRITKLGTFIRLYKIDEIPNLINILKGEMSFVGPRPNVNRETDIYSEEEKFLLTVKPGITDFSSIVFSDEGDILKKSKDPDLTYNQLIRPWKSRLGLYYVRNNNIFLDIKILFLTFISLFKKSYALNKIEKLLNKNIIKINKELLNIVKRETPLYPYPPPGMDEIVKSRL
tara:strand:+ start:345 stop:1094 length:750 start_codon:yes stop_codon:yes gene_type:complete